MSGCKMVVLSKVVNISGELPKVNYDQTFFIRSVTHSHLLLHTIVENENHCDFRKLRSLLIRTHMLDLISTTEEIHYENYRQQQRSEEHTSELQSPDHLVCRLLLEKKNCICY